MDFDYQWLLLGLPVAFALGWIASRLDARQWKREQRESPRAYFKGLNLLLNEQQDKAIDAFIEAVQHDPDTSDLHFALGNLFRRRGEFERAVRVHEHLLNRADLPAADRERARHALAQDFMKAGLFDRAEEAYRALEGTPFDTEARLALLSLYERSRDWRAAVEVAAQLEKAGAGSFASRIAHYWCEIALEADARGQAHEADDALRRARAAAPQAARAMLMAGERHVRAGRPAEALQAWLELANRSPAAFNLIAPAYARAAIDAGQRDAALALLVALHERLPSIDLLHAIALLDGGRDAAQRRRAAHLARQPSLSVAAEVLREPAPAWTDGELQGVRDAVGRAARPLQRYRCAACGFETQHYFWQCPGCLNWDSYPPQRIEEL
jgi:lipopolysaccharide biosynthesis regulator YciM